METNYVWCCRDHNLKRLELLEAEAWDRYIRAWAEHMHHEKLLNKQKAESWKVAARAHHVQHNNIMKRTGFSLQRQLQEAAGGRPTDWTGYLRKGSPALERAEERVLVG